MSPIVVASLALSSSDLALSTRKPSRSPSKKCTRDLTQRTHVGVGVELHRATGRGCGSLHRLGTRVEALDLLVGHDPRQVAPGQSETRVEIQRALQSLPGLQMMLGVEELVVAERHEDAFPGVELGEGAPLEALALDLEDDTVHVAGGRDDLAADRVAGFEEVALGEVAVVAPRPDLSAALHRDELSRHAQTAVAAAHRPLEDVAGSQLPSGLACIHGPRAVALGGARREHDRLAGGRDSVDDVAPEARREVLEVGVAGGGAEGQHRDHGPAPARA